MNFNCWSKFWRTFFVFICILLNFILASFVLNIPYYIYYNQISFNITTETSQQITLIHYCVARFPSPNLEITLTMYTVLISYVLPLLTIIFCYARMMIKILKNAKNQLFEEYKSISNKSIRQDDLNSMITDQTINQTEIKVCIYF